MACSLSGLKVGDAARENESLMESPARSEIICYIRKTHTCIHTPGYPPMVPDELSKSKLFSVMDGANLVYFDVRLHETALVVAEEQSTEAPSTPSAVVSMLLRLPNLKSAVVSMLLRLPNLKFVVATLGERGCIMLERSINDSVDEEETDIESLLELLKQKADPSLTVPMRIASMSSQRIKADGIRAVSGRLLIGTAEVVPPADIIDTTGAGDAFIGAV